VKTSERCWQIALAIAAIIGIAVRVWLIIETPYNTPPHALQLSAYNDEAAHVNYTSYVLQHTALPTSATPITEWQDGKHSTFENYQSPLYYIIHAALCKVFGLTEDVGVAKVGRWLALIMFGILLVTAWKIGAGLNSDLSAIAIPFAIFLLLSGVFVRFSTLAGNESAAWLMAGLIVLSYLRALKLDTIRPVLVVTALFVAGLYVKLSLLLLSPLALHILWVHFRLHPARALLISSFAALALSPLAWRNLTQFGALVPLDAGFGDSSWRLIGFDTMAYFARSSVFPFSEFWQGWKGVILMLPASALLTFVLISALAKWRLAPVVVLSLGLTIAAYLWLNSRYDQAEARYLFVAWPAFLIGIGSLPAILRSPWILLTAFTLPYLLFVV